MAGSSQDQPNMALAASPTRTAPACAAHIMFCKPSPLVASELSRAPRRCLVRPSSGMTSRLNAVTTRPRVLVVTAWPPSRSRSDSMVR